MAASKARFYTVADSPFSACASLALPGGHAKGRPGSWGAVAPTTHTVATRAAAAAPVGGGGGLGREELSLPPRACAAAGCPATSPPVHAVTDHRVIGVGARPQGISPVRRVVRAAVARSRWDPLRAVAWHRNRHTLPVGGKGGGGVSVFVRYRLWHLSGPAGGGSGASASSSAAAPAFVFCWLAGRRRGKRSARVGVSRRADRFREQGAMRRSGDGGPTAAAVSPGNPPPG